MKKGIISIFACFLPCNRLRIFALNLHKDFSVSSNCKIGWGNIFNCKLLKLSSGVKINKFNRFNCGSLVVDANTYIKSNVTVNGESALTIGSNCVVNNGIHFDLAATINIADNVVFGGRYTELWTHGYDWKRNKLVAPIKINSDVYVGSRVIINPGVKIASQIAIGAGTILSKSARESNSLITSNPQKSTSILPLSDRDLDYRVIHGEYIFERK